MKKTIIGAIALFMAGGIFATAIIHFSGSTPETVSQSTVTTINEQTETTTYNTVQSSYMSIDVSQDSHWQDGTAHCYGYSVPVKNTLNRDITDWKLEITFSDNVEILQLWNGNYTVDGKVLTISPVDYNKTLSADGVLDVGFNCKTPSESEITSAVLYESGTKIGEYVQGIDVGSSASRLTNVMTAVPTQSDGTTPFEKYGKLSVKGTNLVGSDGNNVTLQGVSTHGIAWFPQYVNKAAFQSLRDNMNVDVIRLALYSSTNEGYSKDLYSKVDEGVEYAKELGMYAIIDWHVLGNGNPNTDKESAKEFFTYMSQKYCSTDNVIYEICNEPNGDVQWERDIKPYAQEIISLIRQYDNDAIIIVGTPTWSQDVDIVAQSPIENQTNIMYALHFYAATHGQYLRDKLVTALNAGLPIFVTEFGISDASGGGSVNVDEANKWISLLREKNISYVCWNLSNKAETCSLIDSNCSKLSDWTENDLTQSGKWLLETYK